MSFKKITATVRCEILEDVKNALKEIGVQNIAVGYVANLSNNPYDFEIPSTISHAKIEILTDKTSEKVVANCILENARIGSYDDGVVFVTDIGDCGFHHSQNQAIHLDCLWFGT